MSRYLGTSEWFWMNLQARHDLEIEKDWLGVALDDIRPLSAEIAEGSSRTSPRYALLQCETSPILGSGALEDSNNARPSRWESYPLRREAAGG
jgi:hypothetical protein